MAFKPAHRPALYLPIPLDDGSTKVYKILAPSAKTGLLVSQAFTLSQARADGRELTDEEKELLDLSGDKEEQFDRDLFGGQKQAMMDDGVDLFTFGMVRMTVMVWVQSGKDAAEAYWNAVTSEDEDPEGEGGPKETGTSDAESKDQPDSTDGSTTPKPARKRQARKQVSAGSTSTETGTSSKPTSSNATESTPGTVDF